MADWIFNKSGNATMIYDSDCIRNNRGQVVAWLYGNNIYSLSGQHKGWFDGGVFYDSNNKAIGFLSNSTGYLPSRPGISGRPGMPGFSGKPGRAGFSGVPGRPGYGGWSVHNFENYF
ncbi:4-fold beta flower protein [Pontibacter liquoris]|uniref:4-fold beta flower protein n=1 Tax=Pontibacter liquoris TaxID=2905677 RepID=UPI001FA7DAE1|nr:hypothetical protein [Pontibacter liquoris]